MSHKTQFATSLPISADLAAPVLLHSAQLSAQAQGWRPPHQGDPTWPVLFISKWSPWLDPHTCPREMPLCSITSISTLAGGSQVFLSPNLSSVPPALCLAASWTQSHSLLSIAHHLPWSCPSPMSHHPSAKTAPLDSSLCPEPIQSIQTPNFISQIPRSPTHVSSHTIMATVPASTPLFV